MPEAPATLTARSGDAAEPVVKRGAPLPAAGRIVGATTRAGQDALEVDLLEDGERLVARARFDLPRGLPPNCWIPVEVRVDADLSVRAEARENLRRIRVTAELDAGGATAEHFRA